jgi:alpha-ribazole phosphatase
MSASKHPGETRWWWVRHAPVDNPGGAIYGQSDVPANCSDEAGLRGAAARLPNRAVWLITPLQRTRQTAEGLLAAADGGRFGDPPLTVEPEFMEQNFGDWQGRPRADLYAVGSTPHPFWISPATERPPGGESFVELMERVHRAVARRSQDYRGHDIVAVAHGGPIRAAIALALGLDAENALRFVIDNLSVTRLDLLAMGEAAPEWRIGGINLPPR